MNFKRIGRALICLILVCALLVNMSPIRAEAIVIDSLLVSASMVALSCMLGLGVGFQTYEIAEPYIDDCVAYLQSIDFVDAAEQISIYSAGAQQYYASQEMVQAVRDWLFASGTVVCGECSDGYFYYNGFLLPELYDYYSYKLVFYCENYYGYSGYFSLITSRPICFYASDSELVGNLSYYASYWVLSLLEENDWHVLKNEYAAMNNLKFSECTLVYSSYDVVNSDNSSVILAASEPTSIAPPSVAEDLVAFEIASKDEDFATGYSSWIGNSISIPGQLEDDEPIVGLPLGLGPNLSDMIGLTQDDVWNGTSTYIPDVETESTEPSIGVPSGSLGATDAAGFLGSLLDALMDVFEWFWGKIETFFGPWIDRIESWFSDVVSSIQAIPNALSGFFSDIIDAISSIPSTFRDWLLGIVDAIAEIPGAFAGWFADIIGGISSIPESIADVFGGVIDGVIALPGTIADVFADVIAGVIALPQTIADAITDAISALFVPANGFIETKVEALTSKFPFAKTIADSSLEMKKFLLNLGQQPPIIYIDLGAATGSYMWGGKTIFVDLTWYAQYKGTMDVVISAFLWLWFVWRMTLALPGIIQGTSGFWSKPDIPKENTSLTITGDSSHYFRR